jgi:hypothetical protein
VKGEVADRHFKGPFSPNGNLSPAWRTVPREECVKIHSSSHPLTRSKLIGNMEKLRRSN